MRVIIDHTCLSAMLDGDPFLNDLYVESTYGTARLVVPSLSLVVAEEERTGHAARSRRMLKQAEFAPFEAVHAMIHAQWPKTAHWQALHPAALYLQEAAAGAATAILSLRPELYGGTGVTPLNPHA
jgi:hypothetical protein